MNHPTPPSRAHAEAFLAAAAALLGVRGLTTDPERVDAWLTDWRGRYTGRALALASPASTAEVSALVKLCAAHGVPIVPQGGNSGMAGGATPDASGTAILLSLRRMDRIRQIDPATGQAVCEAGVILQSLHDAADAAGLRFPLTLGGKGSATIGGLIAHEMGHVPHRGESFELSGLRFVVLHTRAGAVRWFKVSPLPAPGIEPLGNAANSPAPGTAP